VWGTSPRPWLAQLESDALRSEFLQGYRDEVDRYYPARPDGRVLFPFIRRFVIAYR